MQFKHLVTHYLWTRSFSRSELAKYIDSTEKKIFAWEQGEIPTPSEALNFQRCVSYPKVDFWKAYFNSISLDMGEDLLVHVREYEDQERYLKNSIAHRRVIKHNSIPADELWDDFGLAMDYSANPQTLQVGLQVQIAHNKRYQKIPQAVTSLAKNLDLDLKTLEKLLNKDLLPEYENVRHLISRKDPSGRKNILLGYFSSIISYLNLMIHIEKEMTPSFLLQLENMAKRNPDMVTVFRKKKKKRSARK